MSPKITQTVPKYVQVADYIREQIMTGELKPGDALPSERQIVEEWGVSRPTATKALSALRVEGLVEARQGSGTFVRVQPTLSRRARDRYARAKRTGRSYLANERVEILFGGIVAAPEEVAAALGLESGAEAIRRQRVIYASEQPVEVSTSWFSATLADSAPLLADPRPLPGQGTLAYIEERTDRKGQVARDRISARLATPQEAAALRLGEEPSAVLLVHHETYDQAREPIEFVEAVYPPGQWTFEEDYPI